MRARNINLWLDTLDIPKGSIWDVEIEKALNNADFLLAILTPSAVESNNVMDEISYALEQKKIVVPILLKDCNIPFRLRRRQYISFKEDYDNSLNELLNTLKIKGGLANKTREEDNTKDTKLKLGTPLATNDTKTSTSNTSSNTFKYKKTNVSSSPIIEKMGFFLGKRLGCIGLILVIVILVVIIIIWQNNLH